MWVYRVVANPGNLSNGYSSSRVVRERIPMASPRLSATRIGVGALIALTLSTAVATVVNLQSGNADSVPTAIATSPVGTNSGAGAAQYAIDLLAERGHNTGGIVREKNLADLLPNHKFSVGDSDPVTLAAGIVVGTITKVERGAAYLSDPASGEDIEVPFDDQTATSRDLIVTVSVESALGDVSGNADVTFGLAIDGSADPEKAIASFEGLGRVIAVLDAAGNLTFEPDLHSVRQSGGLLGTVTADDEITFPFFGDKSAEFLDGLNTVADVLTEATGPDVISKVDRAGSTPSTD